MRRKASHLALYVATSHLVLACGALPKARFGGDKKTVDLGAPAADPGDPGGESIQGKVTGRLHYQSRSVLSLELASAFGQFGDELSVVNETTGTVVLEPSVIEAGVGAKAVFASLGNGRVGVSVPNLTATEWDGFGYGPNSLRVRVESVPAKEVVVPILLADFAVHDLGTALPMPSATPSRLESWVGAFHQPSSGRESPVAFGVMGMIHQ